MDTRAIGITLILVAICSLTGAQLTIKNVLSAHGVVPLEMARGFAYVIDILQDWRAWVGGFGLIIASLLWYAAVSRLPLSVAYPFAAMSYPMIFAGSLVFLKEPFSWQMVGGNILIVLGVVLVATVTSN